MKVKNDEEAIRWMQDTEYGLTASVYSSQLERAEKILQQINAGSGYWNCCDRVYVRFAEPGRTSDCLKQTSDDLQVFTSRGGGRVPVT